MKGDYDEYNSACFLKKFYKKKFSEETSANTRALLSELMKKENEIELYKQRLKELESAFYYNMEIISERDLELGILEKKLHYENERLEQIMEERNDLEDLLKTFDDRTHWKIKQLESQLIIKEEEIKELQKNNLRQITSLRQSLEYLQRDQQKKIYKLSRECDLEKKNMLKKYREEIEEKENYYLFEIDKLSGKLEDLWKEKEKITKMEEENKNLKNYMHNMEKYFREKENNYKEEMKRMSKACRRINQETDYKLNPKVAHKQCQAEPSILNAESQTKHTREDSEDHYKRKISFLSEQNEVLKYVIKDLKRNRGCISTSNDNQREDKCSECQGTRKIVEEVKTKFQNEIDNIKKILQDEQTQRAEEEIIIESLETNLVCLKDKLLSGLQHKLENFSEMRLENFPTNSAPYIQNEIQILLLEQKLSKKIDGLYCAAEEERQKVYEKLEELKKECLEKIEKMSKPSDESITESESLLEKIRLEIQKLEYKIESDMKNIVRNNSENDKYFPVRKLPPCDFKLPENNIIFDESFESVYQPHKTYFKNDISTKNSIKSEPQLKKLQNKSLKK